MIRGALVGDRETIARLGKVSDKARPAVKQSIVNLTLRLLAKVKSEYLSGQVLNVRTGRLRRSINQRITESGSRIEGIVGTNVEYARVHELGFKGVVSVKAHARKIKQAWGKPLKSAKVVQVAAHTRNVDIPKRAFLLPALREMDDDARKEISAALNSIYKGRL